MKLADLERRNAALTAELSDAKAQLAAREKELAEKLQLLKAARENASGNVPISKQISETHPQGLEFSRREAEAKTKLQQSEAELFKLRQDLKNQAKAASERQASLNQLIARRDAALTEQRAKIAELSESNRILKRALDTIEEYFRKLRESRSFHFAIYTARRLGLVSRQPRRLVEGIKDQFPATRKALKQVRDRDFTVPRSENDVNANSGDETLISRRDDEADRKRTVAEVTALRSAASKKNTLALPAKSPLEDASVCLVIFDNSGEHHLRNLFNSFLKVNTFPSVECSVVLRACTDGSREVIRSFRDQLHITVIDCPDNHSFAYSNNRAAEQASADYLIFLNSCVLFQHDVVPELLRCLQDPKSGLVGMRLIFPRDDPKYPAGLQNAGIKFRPDALHFFYRPFDLGAPAYVMDTPRVLEKFPAVTAALVACRREQFLEVGGFCEDYLSEYEDVDLSLSFRRLLGLRSVSANQIAAVHNERAADPFGMTETAQERRLNNISHFTCRHGWYLRRKIFADKMRGTAFFSDEQLTAAFAVTEATAATAAGDFFSASELANACVKEFGWNVRFLARNEDWYDLRDIDVLVVLLDAYDLSRIRDAKPDLVKVAWMRNWFERWSSRPDFDQYDLFLCSSQKSAQWLRDTRRKDAWVFPLATNPERFGQAKPESRLSSDYCFTGSYWQFEREIGAAVQPKLDDYKFVVFGKGWEKHPTLSAYAHGFLPYGEMPNVYASTRIVVDDANHVTKEWGSINSRVFDALAAGALVITNNQIGAGEMFEGELPTYRSPEELQSLLRCYLGDEAKRRELTERLRQRVLVRQTYRHRARTLKRILISRVRRGYRIALKIDAPSRHQIRQRGDYHLARSLGRWLALHGHSFRIDCLSEWERPESFGDDVVIALRGLNRYRPKPGQINLIWNITPDKISDEECEEFDHVFVASRSQAAKLADRLQTSVSSLLPCTDPDLFYPDPNPEVPVESLLFVGDSQEQYRQMVRFAVEEEMPVGVYGKGWEMFIPASYIRGEYIESSVLRQHYSRCEILLNDHRPAMRDLGYISNRLFDAAACGAFVISDAMEEAYAVFGEDLVTCKSESEFRSHIRYYLAHPEERYRIAERLRSRVLSAHTFTHRAEEILANIKELDKRKRGSNELKSRPMESVVKAYIST